MQIRREGPRGANNPEWGGAGGDWTGSKSWSAMTMLAFAALLLDKWQQAGQPTDTRCYVHTAVLLLAKP